jgi:hypothetical protein
MIDQLLKEIKDYIGLELTPCDYFTGVKTHNQKYFNVMLKTNCSESEEYTKLLSLASKNILIQAVEPNGVRRLAIYFK